MVLRIFAIHIQRSIKWFSTSRSSHWLQMNVKDDWKDEIFISKYE